MLPLEEALLVIFFSSSLTQQSRMSEAQIAGRTKKAFSSNSKPESKLITSRSFQFAQMYLGRNKLSERQLYFASHLVMKCFSFQHDNAHI